MSLGDKLKLGTGVATQATKGPEKDSGKPDPATMDGKPLVSNSLGVGELKPGAPETAQDVKDRLDSTQPVSGDNDVASQTPEEVRADPPTPAKERKDTLANRDLRTQLEDSVGLEEERERRETADDGKVRFSSHPILRYGIGRFQFENGLLTLDNEKDIAEFRKIVEDLPRSERSRITELDISAAEAQSRAVRAANPKASKAIGSDSGDRDPGKQVGKGRLEDSGQ